MNHREWVALWEKQAAEHENDGSGAWFRSMLRDSIRDAERRAWAEYFAPPRAESPEAAHAKERFDEALRRFRAAEELLGRVDDSQPYRAEAAALAQERARLELLALRDPVQAAIRRGITDLEWKHGFAGAARVGESSPRGPRRGAGEPAAEPAQVPGAGAPAVPPRG